MNAEPKAAYRPSPGIDKEENIENLLFLRWCLERNVKPIQFFCDESYDIAWHLYNDDIPHDVVNAPNSVDFSESLNFYKSNVFKENCGGFIGFSRVDYAEIDSLIRENNALPAFCKFILREKFTNPVPIFSEPYDTLLKEWGYLSENVPESADEAVLVRSYLDIEEEYRFFVIGHEVVASSVKHDALTPLDNLLHQMYFRTPLPVHTVADNIVDKIYIELPDMRNYVLDLCVTSNGDIHIVETNPLVRSGLYGCSYKRVFDSLLNESRHAR